MHCTHELASSGSQCAEPHLSFATVSPAQPQEGPLTTPLTSSNPKKNSMS